MDILFIIDTLETLDHTKDSSLALMRAALLQKCPIFCCGITDLFYTQQARAYVYPVVLVEQAWRSGERHACALREFAAIFMRVDPPVDQYYMHATRLLSMAQREGVYVVNDPQALRDHNEKLAILEFPDDHPASLVTANKKDIHAFITQHQDIVIKPLDGMQGWSVFRLQRSDHNCNALIDLMTENGQKYVMVQRYLPAVTQGDKRIIVVAGHPVPWGLLRVPAARELRANLAAGGQGIAVPLTEKEQEMAQRIGTCLCKRGLFLIGLDVIGEQLTEINVTNPTCLVEIHKHSGFDAAAHTIQQLMQRTPLILKGPAPDELNPLS